MKNYAARAHADGVSCITYGAVHHDGHGRRSCIDCGAPLGEQEWHPDGDDVPVWFWISVAVGLAMMGYAAWVGFTSV